MYNKNLRRDLFFILAIVMVFVFIWSCLYFNYAINNAVPISFSSLFNFLSVFGVLFLVIVFLCVFAFAVYKFIDHTTAKTQLHLLGNDISARLRLKSANRVYPCLLSFLYFVLDRNNEFLKLPLGKDCSALIPNGYKPIFRQNSLFYLFQLVMPEKSTSFDDVTLKKLIQSYIDNELINYGIAGLNSCFNSRIYGNVPSVVVDRVYYNEKQHMLNFSVLYVCTEEDVKYAIRAEKRDKKLPENKETVYDDEL